MPPGNSELAHQAIDAFNRRDLAAFLDLMDPDIEFMPYEVAVQGGDPYRGHFGIRTWWEESFSVIPDFRAEIDELTENGDMLFMGGRLRGQGASSGATFERGMWLAIEWQGGKETRWHSYETRAEARAAVGLAE